MRSEQKKIVAAGEPRTVVLGEMEVDEDPVEGGGLYLAYGPNLMLRQMEERAPGFRPVGRVRIKGQRLAFGSNGVATLVPNRNAAAAGAVYEMTKEDFRKMDSAEGVTRMRKYRRWRAEVGGFGGRQVFVYLLSSGPDRGVRPTGEILKRIVAGMNEWGFEAEAADLRRRVRVPLAGNVAIREVAGKKRLIRIGVYVDPKDPERAPAAREFARWLDSRFRDSDVPVRAWTSARAEKFGDVAPERMAGRVLIEGVGGAPVFEFLRRWHGEDSSWKGGKGKKAGGGSEYLEATLDGIYRLIPDVILSDGTKKRSPAMEARAIIPDRIRSAREMRGLNQQELAKMCGFAQTMLSHIERGTRLPRVDKVRAIAETLDVSADYLLGLSGTTATSKEGVGEAFSRLTGERQEMVRKMIEELGK